MNVKEFIKWLETLPQDAKVQSVRHSSGSSVYMQGGDIDIIDFTSEEATNENNWNQEWELYIDKEGNKTLLIGSHCN